MTMYVRLAVAQLTDPVSDPTDRNVLPMSTLILSDAFMTEVSWDGCTIGDAQVYKNRNCNANGVKMKDASGHDLPDDWMWWAGVPRAKIKSYRFADSTNMKPQTVADPGLPFELPNAQRKEESRQAGKGSSPRA